jgi:hypothetical protein
LMEEFARSYLAEALAHIVGAVANLHLRPDLQLRHRFEAALVRRVAAAMHAAASPVASAQLALTTRSADDQRDRDVARNPEGAAYLCDKWLLGLQLPPRQPSADEGRDTCICTVGAQCTPVRMSETEGPVQDQSTAERWERGIRGIGL